MKKLVAIVIGGMVFALITVVNFPLKVMAKAKTGEIAGADTGNCSTAGCKALIG